MYLYGFFSKIKFLEESWSFLSWFHLSNLFYLKTIIPKENSSHIENK